MYLMDCNILHSQMSLALEKKFSLQNNQNKIQ